MTEINIEHKVEEVSQLLKDIHKNFIPAVLQIASGAEDMLLTDLIALLFSQY